MKKSIAFLATAMMAGAMGMPDPFATRGGIPRPQPAIKKENRKKCKSCKCFQKGLSQCDCAFSTKKWINPLREACSYYVKRKKQ